MVTRFCEWCNSEELVKAKVAGHYLETICAKCGSNSTVLINHVGLNNLLNENAALRERLARLEHQIEVLNADLTRCQDSKAAIGDKCLWLDGEVERLRRALKIAYDFKCEWNDCRRWTNKVCDDFCYFHKAIFKALSGGR